MPPAGDDGPAPAPESPDPGGGLTSFVAPPAWLLGRGWVTVGVLLPVGAGAAACGFSAAGAAGLVEQGLPAGELLADELVRAAVVCAGPCGFAAAAAWVTGRAPFARPLAVLCGAAAAWGSLDAGVRDYEVTRRGRGEGVRRPADVWPVPLMLGGLAAALWLEHRHGRGSVADDAPYPRLWRGEE